MSFLTMEIKLSLSKMLLVVTGLISGGIFLGAAFSGNFENGYLYAAIILLSSGTIILKSRDKKKGF